MAQRSNSLAALPLAQLMKRLDNYAPMKVDEMLAQIQAELQARNIEALEQSSEASLAAGQTP
jgi:hypothetical protein